MEIPNTFEVVKEAYPIGLEPDKRFIQFWIDGNDYALTEEYYRGGIKPSRFFFELPPKF